MRKAPLITLAIGVALLGSAATNGAGGVAGKPTLKLTRGLPLTLRGAHFQPREQVRVAVSAERKVTKRVSANASGVFVAGFQTTYDRCDGLLAVAVGSRGSRAMLKMPQLGCPPGL